MPVFDDEGITAESGGGGAVALLEKKNARIAELGAALARSENLLTALAMGFAKNVTVDLVCDERHLTAVLKEARAALGSTVIGTIQA